MLAQVVRTGPDGALLDPQAFINFARSNLQVMRDLPPHLVQAVNQGDTETLQRLFRCVHASCSPEPRLLDRSLQKADSFMRMCYQRVKMHKVCAALLRCDAFGASLGFCFSFVLLSLSCSLRAQS